MVVAGATVDDDPPGVLFRATGFLALLVRRACGLARRVVAFRLRLRAFVRDFFAARAIWHLRGVVVHAMAPDPVVPMRRGRRRGG